MHHHARVHTRAQCKQLNQKLYRSLKALTDDFLAVCKRVDLVRSCKAQRTIEGLVGTSSGVFVVRLLRGNICDHVVAVDCDRRIILDGVEEHPLRLTAEYLALCTGEEGTILNVREGEVRELLHRRWKM